MDAFVTRLAGNRQSEGFFWYAGHAVQVRDENYLLPVDVTIDSESRVRATSYSLNNLLEALEGARNKVNVLVLDACRTNPLPASGRAAGNTRGLSMVRDVPSDLFVMFSTQPGNVADDGVGKRNSPFAEAFLKHIKSSEPLTLMAADVTNETMNLTGSRQRPFTRGSIVSEKYYSLNPSAAPSVAVTPQPVPAPAGDIDAAIKRAAEGLMRNIPNGAKVALVAITASDKDMAEFVCEELEVLLINSERYLVIDRYYFMDIAKSEFNLRSTDELCDNAIFIGRSFGASVVITGSISGAGSTRRLQLQLKDVHTERILSIARELF